LNLKLTIITNRGNKNIKKKNIKKKKKKKQTQKNYIGKKTFDSNKMGLFFINTTFVLNQTFQIVYEIMQTKKNNKRKSFGSKP